MDERAPVRDGNSPLEPVAVGAALLTGFGIAAALYVLNVDIWWIGFPMIGGLVPLAVGLAKQYERSRPPSNDERGREETADALEQLRERYARDEIDEAEFERRVERLLETETVAEARAAAERRRAATSEAGDQPADETTTGPEHETVAERE